MSRKLYVSAALAALALCALPSCVKEVLVEDKPAPGKEEQAWTVTMEATKAEKDPETKALLLSDDEKEIDFHWAGTDEVQVYDAGGTLRGTMTPELAGSTTTNTTQLKGTIDGDFVVGETYTLYFLKKPAAENAYAAQKGTVADIAENFDYATATVEVKEVDSVNKTVVFSHAAFESQQSITKFIFRYSSGTPGDIRHLTILAPGRMDPVTIIPANPAMEFHVALPRIDSGGEKIVYTFLAEAQNGDIYEGTKKAALQAGKYYRATVGLAKYAPIATPLTIEALEDGVITISNPLNKKIRWNAEEEDFFGEHAQFSEADPIEIPVTAGQRVILGGINTAYAKAVLNGGSYRTTSTNIRCSARHYLYGNVMSLRDVQSYANPNAHAHIREIGNYAFHELFRGTEENPNSTLLNHPVKSIELPATTVGRGAYGSMFSYCTSLEIAPELPATSFAGDIMFESNDGPYSAMFNHCYSLKKAPSRLPAKTIPYCYNAMFQSCWSLEASPILEDENPANRAYNYMFSHCGNLKQITCYSRNNLWDYYRAPYMWVGGVSPTGVFIKHPNADWEVGDSGIPAGWTSDKDPLIIEAIEDGTITINNPRNLFITWGKDASMASATTSSLATISIPVSAGDKLRLWGDNPVYGHESEEYNYTRISGSGLHYVYGDLCSLVSSGGYTTVTALEPYAFTGLFMGDTKLKSHPTETLVIRPSTVGTGCFRDMFKGCTALEQAPSLPATTLAPNCYESMFSGCTSLTLAPDLPATTLAEGSYGGMFFGCTALQNPPAISATTLAMGCCMNMFTECSALKESPVLSAGTLAPYCYSMMFSRCTSLKKITCTASNISAENALMDWVDGVPAGASGTFIKKSGVTWPSGISGIPTGWTVQQQ
ncbi:MAG: leucine-rich repeat protein [Bacteroidales bacterium]|nr:leucine-rich repeat protein [Bacteroidales bacterium]